MDRRALLGCLVSVVVGGGAGASEPSVPHEVRLELAIEALVPLRGYSGNVLVASPDPRFVLTGVARRQRPPGLFAPGARLAFAIHSPARLGLGSARAGEVACLIVTRTHDEEQTRWSLRACNGRP